MNKLVNWGGAGAFVYAALAVLAQKYFGYELDPKQWQTALALLFGGPAVVAAGNWPSLRDWASAKLQSVNLPDLVKSEQSEEDLCKRDYECIDYLAHRLSEAKEKAGLDLLRELNDIFFDLHHVAGPREVEDVKTT